MRIWLWLSLAVAPMVLAQDRAAIEKAMPDVQREAQAAVSKTDLLNQFFVKIEAGQYEEAVLAFDAWQPTRAPRAAGQYFDPALRVELYMRAKAAQAREGGTYERAFRNVIAEKFAQFSDRAAYESGWFLGTPVAVLQGALQRQLGRRGDPLELVRLHVNLLAAESFAPFLDAALTADDANRFIVQTDVMIRTKTGATISAMVVRKKNMTGPQPAALFHQIYTDATYNLHEAKESALRGYVGVVSDPRGKRLSPDPIIPWEHDAEDINAVIDWISKQPWSDGQVGMYGASYMGFAQWAAVKHPHPALKTIVPAAASFPGNGIPMQNNVFQNVNYGWPFYVTNNKYLDSETYNDRARWSGLVQKWYASGRPYREIDAVDGTPNPLLQKQMQHPSYDAYWRAMQPYKEEFAKIDIPVLTLTGYFDDANPAAVNYLVDHYKYNPRANHYLVIGPYNHGGVADAVKSSVVNGYTIDAAAQINSVELTYQWFDYVMRGGPKPALLKDRINYEVMGANVWRHAPSLKAMGNKTLKLYLSNTHALTEVKPAAGALEQTVDLADRTSSNNLSPQGAIEENVDYPTRLVFVSEPFDAPVSVDGMLQGVLKATIDKRDMDFAVALYEQMPDGKYFNLSHYLGRASYAADMATRKLLKPGKVATLPFERTPLISRQMSKGSRLVLLVTVNKNAYAQVNYGTGKDVSDESIADAKEPLHVKWHTDSYIEVPLRVE